MTVTPHEPRTDPRSRRGGTTWPRLHARIAPHFARPEVRAPGGPLLGRACSTRWSGATAGSWPRRWGSAVRMGCSGCCAPRAGTPMRCGMTCGPMWSSTWAIRRRCWSSTRPGFSRKGPSRSGWRGNTPARRGGSRTARSGSSWAMPAGTGMPSWTGSSICQRVGGGCGRAGRTPGCHRDVRFATKGELAQAMLARAFAAEVPAGWVTGDEVYGNDGGSASLAGGRAAVLRVGGGPFPSGLGARGAGAGRGLGGADPGGGLAAHRRRGGQQGAADL